MKIVVVTLALLMTGLVFLAPPLIAVLPVLLVGLFLMASPMMLSSLARGPGDKRTAEADSAVLADEHRASGTTVG